MRRDIAIATVRLFAVVQVFIAAGVANAQTMKVACVGDSITALPSGWCGYLGTALGSGYMAQTFGVSGTTLLKNTGGLGSYSASSQYKPSHDFAPNIVVIMLGTNDSMPRNWMTGKDHFIADFEELIDSYTSLTTKPTVFLNTAPPASDNNQFTISGTTIKNEVNPLIKEVAAKKMCPLVDVWAALDGDVSKLGGSDGVHPGASGSKLIGDAVAKAIMMPMIPTGTAGAGASAGVGGGSANASGAGGSAQAGAGASTSGTSGANAVPAAGASANAGAAGSASTAGSGPIPGSSANPGSSATAGGSAKPPSSVGLAGTGASATAGSSSSSTANAVSAAGTGAPLASDSESSGCSCRMAANSSSKSGPTAALVILLGILIRSRKRNRKTNSLNTSDRRPVWESLMHRNLAKIIGQISIVVLTLTAGVVSAQTVKVACVGDSITALPSSWCGTLTTKLGSGYMVMNFGVSGTNLAKNVSQPYWSSAQYTPSHTFAPNIVIIMLGTNDAFDRSWSSAKSHFVADYKELLDTYTSLASKPKPYMIIPTPIGTSPFGHNGKLLETDVIPLIKQVAMEKMVPTIDGFGLFGGAMFDASLFSSSDQVHPNAQGQQKLGEAVYKVLMETGALGGSGSAGSGATAGTGASAGSGTAATAGAMATAGANAGGAGMAVAGASANAGSGGASTMTPTGASGGGANAGSSASAGSGATTGSTATAAGSMSLAGTTGSPKAGSSSVVNGIGAAGSAGTATIAPPRSDDGGCRTAGSSSTNGGATAALFLLLGLAIRRRRNRGHA